MDQDLLPTAFRAAGLGRLIPQLHQLLRPSIRLLATATDEDGLPVGATKLGGLPDLPNGTAWPTWNGVPQSFLLQCDLAKVQPFLRGTLASALPAQGMLWFFYDAQQATFGESQTDQGSWQIIFAAAEHLSLHRFAAPTTLPMPGRFHACAVQFASELTFSEQPRLEIPGLDWNETDQERYETLLARLAPPGSFTPRHRLLGFPDTIQDDMRMQCELASQGISDVNDPRISALASRANDWHLLLQIDTDAQAGMRWASNGTLYYWLRWADLQARQFAASWLIMQSE